MRKIIETTNKIHGCLEQGGICGRKMSYDVMELSDAFDVPEEIIMEISPDEMLPGYTCSLRELIDHHQIVGHVVRKGSIIQ